MDSAITDFKAITGCINDEDAKRYLLMYNNDLNRAIDRYFNQKNRKQISEELASVQVPMPPRPSAHMNGNSDIEVIEPMDTNEPGPSNARRQLPRRDNGETFHPNPSNGMYDDPDDVRRPMAPVTGQLVNESFQQSWRAGVSRPTNGIFEATTDFRALARQQEQRLMANRINGGPPSIPKPKGLQNLFRSPAEILFVGPWEAARHRASSANKWLLANLQHNSEFACACLNRDIWNKEAVQDIVKKNFIFWQVADDSPDCKRVSAYYNIISYPTVMIIDPRTGEAVCTISNLKDPVSFLEQLMTFLERYPDFPTYDRNVIDKVAKPVVAEDLVIEEAAVNGTKKHGVKRKISESESSSDSKRSRLSQVSNDNPMGEIEELCSNGTKLTTVDREEWRNYIPSEDETTRKIQIVFRLPNNDRDKIDVPDTTSLRALFVFLDGLGLNSRDHVLILSYPRREYFCDRHASQTLRDLGFNSQELIHVDRK